MLVEAILGVVLFGTILGWFLLSHSRANKRPNGFPPGPGRLPFLERFGFGLGSPDPFKIVQGWHRKHGDILGLKLGNYNVLLLNGYDLIKETFNDKTFTGKLIMTPSELLVGKPRRGIVSSDGQPWVEQRRFALKTLRDFGFAKKSMESMAHEDIVQLITLLKDQNGDPMDPSNLFGRLALNSLWYIITGVRFSLEDPKLTKLLDNFKVSSSIISFGGAMNIPWSSNSNSITPPHQVKGSFTNAIDSIKSQLKFQIDEHEKSLQPDHLRDFLDAYLQEISETKDPKSSFYQDVGYENMLVGLLNLLGGGSDPVSTTLSWALFYLAQDLEIQKKLQDEIDTVVGHFRLPSLNDDKLKMPYTEAVIIEIFRKSSILPYGLPHSPTEDDVNFHGFFLPKDTLVLGNLYNVHHDPKIWGDPETFRPERFLHDGKNGLVELNKAHPPVAPFGLGKRICIGEIVSRNNLFLFITSLFQRFRITLDPKINKKRLGRAGVAGGLRSPPSFKVIFQDRLEFLDRHELDEEE